MENGFVYPKGRNVQLEWEELANAPKEHEDANTEVDDATVSELASGVQIRSVSPEPH
jgi:hypothetical protein